MNVITGATPTKPKIMIYGGAGVGKSSLASTLDKPIFLDIEGGLNFLDVARTPQLLTLDEFYLTVAQLGREKRDGKCEYNTIVIDSIDWLVRRITEACAGIDKDHLDETLNRSNGGYGNGKQVLENHIRSKLIPLFDALVKIGFGICLVAHADKKSVLDREGYTVDRISPKIDVNTMNTFVEWVDNVFYLKSVDGERAIVLDDDGDVLAKNRLGLSGEVELKDIDFNTLVSSAKNGLELARKAKNTNKANKE